MPDPEPEMIQHVLDDICWAISQKKHVADKNKWKNRQTLIELGWTWDDVFDAMMTLSVVDYIAGPESDDKYPETEEVWKFRKTYEGKLIYIKFKLYYRTTGELRVMSFHFDHM